MGMKTRHNKKRNTAFIYESLIVEATVSVLKKDTERQDKAVGIIKKYFNSDSILRKDLDCYRSLYKEQALDETTCKRIINEAKIQQKLINPVGLFQAQTSLINDINKELSPSVFNNFVPNYKYLATISQLFSIKTSPKSHVILENKIIEDMQKQNIKSAPDDIIDSLVLNKFVDKFNSKYESELLSEQKDLLTFYISSFADNAVELKIFLNEELLRLKLKLTESLDTKEIRDDPEMIQKTNTIVKKLNEFSKSEFDEGMLLTILKTQSLIKEIYDDGN